MKRKTTSYRNKGRAVFLAAIMLVSIVALGFAGTVAAADKSVNSADWDGEEIWEGQEVEVTSVPSTSSDSVTIRYVTSRNSNGEPTSTRRSKGANIDGNTITFDSARLDGENDYVIRNSDNEFLDASGTWNSSLQAAGVAELLVQTLDIEFDENEVGNTEADNPVDLNVVSSRDNEEFNVNVTGEFEGSSLDLEDLEEIFDADGDGNVIEDTYEDDDTIEIEISDGDGTFVANFSQIEDAGEYDFEFEVVDTTASSGASITVTDLGEGELSVADAEQQQGDIAEIVVGQNAASSGTLVIGDEDEFGYQANVSISDFGDLDEITVYFNTYAAGNTSLGPVVWLDSDDRDEGASLSFDPTTDQTLDIDGILDTGDYEMTVSQAGVSETLDEPDDVAALFIESRSTDDINTWTASSDSVEDILDEDADDQVDAVSEAIDSELITPSDAVAHDDFAVYQIEASGLGGLFTWAENETGESELNDQLVELLTNSTFENSAGDSALELRVRETRDSVGPNARRGVVNMTAVNDDDGLVVLHDDVDDQYYVLIDTDTIELDRGTTTNIDLAKDTDYEFDIKFEVRDDRLLVDDPDDSEDIEELYQRVDTGHDIVEREGAFDVTSDDLIELEAAGEQLISGTTNIAPGSEVSIRLRGTGGATFSMSQSGVVVDSDGNFAGEFDFSDRSVDDEFRATLRNVVTEDDNPTADGIVIESVDEAPDDEDETVEDDEDDVADDEDETVEDDEDDVVDDETPGFGVLVALLALLGAALLAARRQN